MYKKGSILNSKETLSNSDEHNLASANVTAKSSRKILVLEILKSLDWSETIYESPFKYVAMENKL